jgi:hypothetical protein
MLIFSSLSIIAFFIFFLAIIFIIMQTIINGISPMPTSPKVKKEVLKIMQNLPKDGTIIELGFGWGNVVFSLAKNLPQHKIIGYENSFIPYLLAKILNIFLGYKNLDLKLQNFYKINLKEVEIIYCYLFTGAMKKLKTKFEKELPPGTIIISNTFSIPEWKANKIFEVNDWYKTKIYLYQI